MAAIIPLYKHDRQSVVLDRFIKLNECAQGIIEEYPYVIKSLKLKDVNGHEISGYESIRRVALALLDKIHEIDRKQVEAGLIERGKV